jgi:hypothetical protein
MGSRLKVPSNGCGRRDAGNGPGCRRRYNAVRQLRAKLRQRALLEWFATQGGMGRGQQRRAAEAFGVSESTISRAMVGILAITGEQRCPCCRQAIPAELDDEVYDEDPMDLPPSQRPMAKTARALRAYARTLEEDSDAESSQA